MLDSLIVADGFEAIFWIVVIVGSLIAQIVKASRQGKQRRDAMGEAPQAGPGGERPQSAPNEDLEAFLRNLSGEKPRRRKTTSPPPPPPPPPPLASPAQAARRRKKPPVPRAKPAVPRAKPVASVPPPVTAKRAAARRQPAGAAEQDRTWRLRTKSAYALKKEQAERKRSELLDALDGADSIRKAVLLREILGPPVALRKSMAGTAPRS